MTNPVEIIARALDFYERPPAAARNVIAALNAAGLVIVKSAPTDDMLAAGVQKCPFGPSSFKTARDVYLAMIEASQTLAADGSSKNPTEDSDPCG